MRIGIIIGVLVLISIISVVLFRAQANVVNIKTIDKYLFNENALYLDIREQSEVLETGTIDGFLVYPLYSYFEGNGYIVRHNGFAFTAADIIDEEALLTFFSGYEAIYVLCRSGNRSAYFTDVLDHIGIDNVYDIGGFIDYEGEHTVLH